MNVVHRLVTPQKRYEQAVGQANGVVSTTQKHLRTVADHEKLGGSVDYHDDTHTYIFNTPRKARAASPARYRSPVRGAGNVARRLSFGGEVAADEPRGRSRVRSGNGAARGVSPARCAAQEDVQLARTQLEMSKRVVEANESIARKMNVFYSMLLAMAAAVACKVHSDQDLSREEMMVFGGFSAVAALLLVSCYAFVHSRTINT